MFSQNTKITTSVQLNILNICRAHLQAKNIFFGETCRAHTKKKYLRFIKLDRHGPFDYFMNISPGGWYSLLLFEHDYFVSFLFFKQQIAYNLIVYTFIWANFYSRYKLISLRAILCCMNARGLLNKLQPE